MEEILRAFGRGEYDLVSSLILLDKLPVPELEKLVYHFVDRLLERRLSEEVFIHVVDYVRRTGVDFHSMRNLREIVEILNDENFRRGAEVLTILCDLSEISGKLLDDTFGFIDSASEADIGEVILGADRFVRAFQKLAIDLRPCSVARRTTPTPTPTHTRDTTDPILEMFESTYKREIQERLILLRDYFGIDFLKKVGVRVMTIRDFETLTYDNAVSYYFECVDELSKRLDRAVRLFNDYGRMATHYENLLGEARRQYVVGLGAETSNTEKIEKLLESVCIHINTREDS